MYKIVIEWEREREREKEKEKEKDNYEECIKLANVRAIIKWNIFLRMKFKRQYKKELWAKLDDANLSTLISMS